MRLWALLALSLAVLASSCDDGLEPVDTDSAAHETLIGILVTPEKVVLPLGTEVQLGATGLLEGRTTRDLTHTATWSSTESAVAEAQNGLDREGVIVGRALGEARVRANVDDVWSNEVQIRVTDATVLGINVEPKEVALEAGDTVQLTAIAGYSDGTRSDASGQVRWITDDASVARLERGGKLVAVAPGATRVRAVWDEHEAPPIPVSVVAAAKPDLAVAGVQAEGAGGVISMQVTVENRGAVGASEVWVDAFVDPVDTPQLHDLGDDFHLIDYIAPGGSAKVSFTFPSAEGAHDLFVFVDIDALVEESNESNNTFLGSVSVGTDQQAGPNLTVTYFDYLVDTDLIYYAVDVSNLGTDDVGEFFVDVYVDSATAPTVPSDGDDFFAVEALAAGGGTSADFLFERARTACRSWILVDSYDYVEETDEADNVVGPLTVTTP